MGYRSDLDILFVYDGEGISTGGSRGQVSLQEYFARVAQRVIATLTCRLAEGALYSADTALRPSGNQGVLVTSWDGFLAYHRERAQTWERQSLVRMRPVAGDAGLGRRVLDEMVSVIFAPGPDPGPAVARMRARIEEERAGGHHVAHVKLGRGGLTDIEFTAQVLQLRHAGAHPPLRWVGTFEALRRARDAGFLAADDADFLVDALRFLRRLEICLRILRDVSVTALPIQPGAEREMDAIARRMDLPDGGALLRRYRDVTEGVRERYLRHVTGTAA
jgi:glutamate-ammonia-ligase adenylyltransferase